LLAREVVEEYEGQARFVVEDFGASARAERFGVDRYPAVFVDEALVARPEDFYAWGGPETGRYLPWGEIESRRRFQADLRRMIDLRLAGEEVASVAQPAGAGGERFLPATELVDLQGEAYSFESLRGRPVLIEFWATWCPPCLSTLGWLGTLDPEAASVVAVAVESSPEEVARMVERFAIPGRVTMGTAELLEGFGGIPAIPTLFLADADGRIVRAFYGAPPDLHEQIQGALEELR